MGLLLAYWAIEIIVRLSAKALPRLPEATMDLRDWLFVAGVSAFTAILFRMTPMVAIRRASLQNSLKDAAKAASGKRRKPARETLFGYRGTRFRSHSDYGRGTDGEKLPADARPIPVGISAERILVIDINLSGPQYFSKRRSSEELRGR